MAAAKARERVLVEPAEILAGHEHRAGVGPFQPGRDHQQGGLARARRADQADRLAGAYMQVDILEDMDTRRVPAERQVDAGKPDRRRMSHRGVVHAVFRSTRPGGCRPVIWEAGPSGPAFRLGHHGADVFRHFCRNVNGARPAERPVRIVVLGDSLSAGFGLAAPDALPAKLERALKQKGIAVAIENAGVSGDTAGRGACAARLVGRRGDRRGDPRARRQRRAARFRPEGDPRGARSDHQAAEGAAHRGAARRNAGAAQFRAGLRAGVRRDLSGTRGRARPASSIRSSWKASPATARSTSPTACIRPRPAWT